MLCAFWGELTDGCVAFVVYILFSLSLDLVFLAEFFSFLDFYVFELLWLCKKHLITSSKEVMSSVLVCLSVNKITEEVIKRFL